MIVLLIGVLLLAGCEQATSTTDFYFTSMEHVWDGRNDDKFLCPYDIYSEGTLHRRYVYTINVHDCIRWKTLLQWYNEEAAREWRQRHA